MTSSTTTPAEQWSAVAGAWDASTDYVERHSSVATDALLRAAALRPGDRVLELATGPGTLGRALSEAVGPTGRVVLSDVAPGMVEVARQRNAPFDNVDVAVVDASAIDVPDGSFDVVVCRMGLMFTPEPAAAFAEVRRVLAVGGRFAALTWAGMEHNPWMTCVGMAAAMQGLVTGGPPAAPGGIFSLGDASVVAALAKGAGFVDVITDEITNDFHASGIDAHIEQVAALAGPLAAAFAAASPEQRAALRETAARLAEPHVGDDGVTFPGRALLVAGRV